MYRKRNPHIPNDDFVWLQQTGAGSPSGGTRTKAMEFDLADPAAQAHVLRACRAFELPSGINPAGTLDPNDRENEGQCVMFIDTSSHELPNPHPFPE